MQSIQTVKRVEKTFNLGMHLPGSKSITLRDYLLSSLAEGESDIYFPGICDDTFRMEDALKKLGIQISKVKENMLTIRGNNGIFNRNEVELDVGLSATSTRLLMGLSLLRKGKTIIDGHESMRARPNKYLLDVLKELGATVTSCNDGYLPVSIVGPKAYSKSISMKGDKSSQYFSALLQIAPVLPEGLEIIVEGELVSKPYIEITINEMKKFGVQVENEDYKRFYVKPQSYKPVKLSVEGDASAASYFSALATIHGGTVKLNNIGSSTVQGDYKFLEICKKLGAEVIEGKDYTVITGTKSDQLPSLDTPINMESMPDVAPTLMAIAPFIPGVTKITGLSTLRIKECDRISAPVKELRKFGVEIVEGADYVEINEWKKLPLSSQIKVETYDDHRMAMSLAVFGTKAGNMEVLNPECVEKTYPLFWKDLSKIYS
ncbi:3-phosphoshikimate 1-carboxyvinyltransferase [Pullulanibacillus camelliae]|uniref:3-phosphoshikimate 1-carboxyvinyltransferase n=1 Tax=Pullulanibacillus camelliae TaxID=1707096 RepID=A0A8J2VQL5_9BACL|nr:3-phosphoshikimate 1-carboxyvinyltransferase [Pullulanibacillus camelliae]GGE35379.1 3-phosphoshikimate 1-carboxyvinyltransferase [Pullulanibacillus camelliae]